MGAKGELNEDAAYGIVAVESFHDGDDFLDGGSFGEGDMPEVDADFLRGFGLHPDIHGGVWTLASLNDGELGLEARELLLKGNDSIRNGLTDGSGEGMRMTRQRRKRMNFAIRVPSMTRAWEEDMVTVRKKERQTD